LTLSGTAVPWPATSTGPGYRTSAGPAAGITPRQTATSAAIALPQGGFAGAAIGLTIALPVAVDLSVQANVVPSVVLVGDMADVTVTVHNDADIAAPGVAVTARLPSGFSLANPVAGYDPDSGVWIVGTVPAHGAVSLALPVRVLPDGPWTTTAEITASQIADIDSTPGDGVATEDDESVVTLTANAPTTPAPTVTTSETAQAAAPTGFTWPKILPAALVGAGLFGLGLVMLLVLAARRRARY
jgi:hypothetical protein